MKKVYLIEDLDCANCANKLERAISNIKHVDKVSVNFLTQKIILEADDNYINEIEKQMIAVAKKLLPDVTINL